MVYNVLDYGALGDGKTNDAAAIQRAIDACTATGGTVLIPGGRMFRSGSIVLKSNVELCLENGAVLQVEAAFSLNLREDTGSVQIFGTKGGAKLSPGLELYSELDGYMTNVTPVCPPESFDDEFQAEIDHFVDCFANGAPCRSPAEDGVQIMRILDAVYESARTGHEVVL